MVGPILGAAIGTVISKAAEKVGLVIDRLVPDKAKAEEIKRETERELMRAAVSGDLAQIELNKIEAANPNLWVSGWRPAIGWTCATGLFLQFIFFPLFQWFFEIAVYVQCETACVFPKPPMLSDMLFELVLAMLGMGALRSFDKYTGVAR